MGYYIRILSPSERVPAISTVQNALAESGLAGTLTAESGVDTEWTQVLLSHTNGREIAVIERNSESSGELVADEVEEFLDEIAECKPSTAAAWLAEYLPSVKTIYAFQLLSGTDVMNGWDVLGIAKESIHDQVGGIFQADGEGFSNEEGYHILWQFSESATGLWWMGLLKDGKWAHFQMDLGNKIHRAAFLRGEIPADAELAK